MPSSEQYANDKVGMERQIRERNSMWRSDSDPRDHISLAELAEIIQSSGPQVHMWRGILPELVMGYAVMTHRSVVREQRSG